MVELDIQKYRGQVESPIARQKKIELIRAFGEKNGDGCLQTLLRLLEHDPGVERENSYLEELLSALKKRALRNPEDPRAVNALIEHLRVRDECWQTAARAAETLGEMGNWRAVEPLSNHVGGGYYLFANSAIRALGEIAERAEKAYGRAAELRQQKTFSELERHAVPVLSAEIFSGFRRENQDAAAVSLVKIGPPALDGLAEATHDAVKKWLEEKSKNERLLPPHEFSLALWVFEKIAERHQKEISNVHKDATELLKLILDENKPIPPNPASWVGHKMPLPRLE